MLKVGITGGMGSGKTSACKVFRELNIPVYSADERGKYLQNYDPSLVIDIKHLFGEVVYDQDGYLDRKKLADIVFKDEKQLQKLNDIVHPAVYKDRNRFYEEHSDQKYIVVESALLVETGAYKMMDKLIVVTAPESIRIARIQKRDGLNPEDISARLRNQLNEELKWEFADFFILNDGSEESLKEQVFQIHQQILAIAK